MPDPNQSLRQSELDYLVLTVADATDMGFAGRVAEGYARIQHGRTRAARRAEFQLPGSAALLELWDSALERFTEEFGTPAEAPKRRVGP